MLCMTGLTNLTLESFYFDVFDVIKTLDSHKQLEKLAPDLSKRLPEVSIMINNERIHTMIR